MFLEFSASSGTALNNAIENDISLDIDENGSYDALTDGLLILRHMFGLTDQALIANAIGLDAQVTSAQKLHQNYSPLKLILTSIKMEKLMRSLMVC